MVESKLSNFGVLGLVACSLFACGGEEEEPSLARGSPGISPIPGCEHESYALCDITESACQERHLSLVACVRGSDPGELPPISTLSPGQYADQLNQAIAEDPPPVPNHWENALVGLGVVVPGAFSPTTAVATQVDNVGGYYRYVDKDIVIIDRGEGMDSLGTNLTLMHEFLHLLQGRDVDLAAFIEERSSTFDGFMAAKAVTEGEAELHETRLAAALYGLDVTSLDFGEHLGNAVSISDEWMFGEPSPYSAAYYSFPYSYGARYVNHAWEASGLPGVLALYSDPPSSTIALLASADGIVASPPALDIPAIPPLSDLTLVTESSLGALGIYLFMGGGTLAFDTALAWAGDRVSVYETPTKGTILVWQVECTGDEAASWVEARFFSRGGSGQYRVARTGTAVTMAYSSVLGADLSWAVAP